MQKESRVEEGQLMPDHVHMMLSTPPKYAVSQVLGYIKGKSAIHLARVYGERRRNFIGQHFWAGILRLDRRSRRSCDTTRICCKKISRGGRIIVAVAS
jgi:REP element-mobilizing transposase RayT